MCAMGWECEVFVYMLNTADFLSLWIQRGHIKVHITMVLQLYLSDGSVGKESACKAGDTGDSGSIHGLGISSGEGNGNLPQYSCLGSYVDRGPCWATVHGVTESDTTKQWQQYNLLTSHKGNINLQWAQYQIQRDHFSFSLASLPRLFPLIPLWIFH